MVRMSRKEAVFYALSTNEAIVDAIHVDDEDKLEVGDERTIRV